MKTTLIFAVCVALCGCKTMTEFPLQPGDKVFFTTRERANDFRDASGNNYGATNRVVEIDQPTSILIKR